jgi:hypothetical protein
MFKSIFYLEKLYYDWLFLGVFFIKLKTSLILKNDVAPLFVVLSAPAAFPKQSAC